MFGVSASPFLLNATLKRHLKQYLEQDSEFVHKIQQSIHVDNIVGLCSRDDLDQSFELYCSAKSRLAEGGFNSCPVQHDNKHVLISKSRTCLILIQIQGYWKLINLKQKYILVTQWPTQMNI